MSEGTNRRIPLTSAPNMRDLGGLSATGGVTKPGVLFRSASLSFLNDTDAEAFVNLGIRTVYDLRTAGERTASPDHVPSMVREVGLDVLADSPTDLAAGLGQLTGNPAALKAQLAELDLVGMMEQTYHQIVTLPSALQSYRALILDLIDPARSGAALFHCTTGKDRTGWAAASVLTVLGVSQADVMADYLQTNTDLLPALAPMLKPLEAEGIDPDSLRPALGVQESYLHEAFAAVTESYGDMHGYFTKGLGLAEDQLQALHTLLVA